MRRSSELGYTVEGSKRLASARERFSEHRRVFVDLFDEPGSSRSS